MAGFRRRRRATTAPRTDGDGRDSTGVAPARRGLADGEIAASRPRATAVEYGISMLAARSWPEKKLREKIRTRYTQDETDAGIERLRELRLVDDAAWSERYARDRFERLGKGRHRIRMELVTKGIDAATADAALERVVGGDDEKAKAAAMLEAMRDRFAGGSPGDPGDPRERRQAAERLKNRLFRRMLARGFPASVVRDLLEIS